MNALRVERRSVMLKITRSDPPAVRVERKAGARITVIRHGLSVGGAPSPAVITRIASQALGGFRVVRVDANNQFALCDPGALDCSNACGITVGAAAQGAVASARSDGEITEAAWNWDEGPIYCGANGTLTQVEPPSGTIVEIGTAIGPQSIRIAPHYLADLAD